MKPKGRLRDVKEMKGFDDHNEMTKLSLFLLWVPKRKGEKKCIEMLPFCHIHFQTLIIAEVSSFERKSFHFPSQKSVLPLPNETPSTCFHLHYIFYQLYFGIYYL